MTVTTSSANEGSAWMKLTEQATKDVVSKYGIKANE
jgi:hypothetical protein